MKRKILLFNLCLMLSWNVFSNDSESKLDLKNVNYVNRTNSDIRYTYVLCHDINNEGHHSYICDKGEKTFTVDAHSYKINPAQINTFTLDHTEVTYLVKIELLGENPRQVEIYDPEAYFEKCLVKWKDAEGRENSEWSTEGKCRLWPMTVAGDKLNVYEDYGVPGLLFLLNVPLYSDLGSLQEGPVNIKIIFNG